MTQTRLRFDSLYFEIYLEFEFCDLEFNQLHFAKAKTISQTELSK